MFCVYVAGDELAPVTHNFRQSFFAIAVDRCHLDQFDDALAGIPHYVSVSPGRPEFSCPLADQLTLQRPPLLSRRVRHSDPQHYSSSLLRKAPGADPTLSKHALSTANADNPSIGSDEFDEPPR